MDIRNIEYFLHLAKYEHVSATADLLHISQPSLSKHITSLEREIGVKLFDRIGNRIVLNKTGEQFAQYAKQAVELLNAGVNSAKRGIYDTKGGIQIAYTSYAPIIADCIAQYTQINPLITFQIIAFEATKMVDSDQLDFLLSSSAGDTLHDLLGLSSPLSGALCTDLWEQIGQRAGSRSGGSLPAQRRVFCHHGPE